MYIFATSTPFQTALLKGIAGGSAIAHCRTRKGISFKFMRLKTFKRLLVSLAVSGLILTSGVIGGTATLASARYGQDQDRWWEKRKPNKEEAKEFRRQLREEEKEIRKLDKQHRLRYHRENNIRLVGYYDSSGSFHRYGYYDRWGYFHKD